MADHAYDVWETWRNSGNTSDINILKFGSSSTVTMRAATGGKIQIGSDSTYPLQVDTNGARLNSGRWSQSVYAGGTVTSSRAVNILDGNCQTYTLGGNTAFSFTNWPSGDYCEVALILTQDGMGSRVPTFSGVLWPNGVVPSLSTTAGAKDVVLVWTPDGGTTKFGNVIGQGYA
jgi:hypothetical protein